MFRFKFNLILLFVAIIMFLSSSVFARVYLVDARKKSKCTIVIPSNANQVEAFAAKELQYHLEKSTGLTPPIVKEPFIPQTGTRVFLGNCIYASKIGINNSALPLNAYISKTSNNDYFICGNDTDEDPLDFHTAVGTLFGVYDLLEKNLGVRWIWPGELGEVVPKRKIISIAETDKVVKPILLLKQWRANPSEGAVKAGLAYSTPEKYQAFINGQKLWLRRQRFFRNRSMSYGHAFSKYYELYGATHPEYFAMLPDGTRGIDPKGTNRPDFIAMCVSQPGLWKQIVEDWKLKGKPDFINLCENDTSGSCVCDVCMSWDVPDPKNKIAFDKRFQTVKNEWEVATKSWSGWMNGLGSLSDRYAKYLNEAYQLAAKERADVKGIFYAYENYVMPPIQTKLNRNILIGIVPPMPFFPWNKDESALVRKTFKGWYDKGSSLFFRPNTTLMGGCFPVSYAKTMTSDLSYGVKHNMLGVDFDSLTGQYATQGPTLYCIARVLNQPNSRATTFLNEYYSAFGPAKNEIKAYYEHWESYSSKWNNDEVRAAIKRNSKYKARVPGGFCPIAYEVFPKESWETGFALLKKAKKAASDNPEAAQRVAFVEKGFINAQLTLEVESAYKYKIDSGDSSKFDLARQRLLNFRKSIEDEYVSCLESTNYYESARWGKIIRN